MDKCRSKLLNVMWVIWFVQIFYHMSILNVLFDPPAESFEEERCKTCDRVCGRKRCQNCCSIGKFWYDLWVMIKRSFL